MSKSLTLRALVSERLTAAAEEIFALVERTIAEYEEELFRSKEENQRKQQLLEKALSKILVHRADAEVQTEAETEGSSQQQRTSESPQTQDCSDISTQVFYCVKTESDEQHTVNDGGSGAAHLVKYEEAAEVQTCPVQEEPGASLLSAFEYEGCSSMEAPAEGPAFEYKGCSSMDPPAEGTDGKDMTKKHECCFCGRRFREERNLQRHIVVHTRQKPFVCAVCSRGFSQEETLRLHMALHSEDITSPQSQQLHRDQHSQISASPTKPTSFSCPLCHKCFTRTFSLQSHMLTHTGEKPFPCPLCSTRFNRKSNLNRHLKVHAQKNHNVQIH